MPSSALMAEEIDSNVRSKLSAHGRPHTHIHTHTRAYSSYLFKQTARCFYLKYDNRTTDERMHMYT